MGLVQDIRNIITEEVKKEMDKLKKDALEIQNEINEIGFKEVNKIYDSFISQYYYDYKTKYYIRHWEGKPGTQKGSNLYYGKAFKIHRGKEPYFEINISDDRMADDYQHDSAIDVLSQIMAGANIITGSRQDLDIQTWNKTPDTFTRTGGMVWYRATKGSYKSRYFNIENATLDEALFTFLNEYDNITLPMFKRRMKQKGWNW